MKNLYRIFLFSVMLSCITLINSKISVAGVDLPWSTSYTGANCNSNWNTYTQDLNCDGLDKNGGWTCSPQGYYEQIITNQTGHGDAGFQRHWLGDGKNSNSGGTYVTFNTPQSEFWVRWYNRYQPGFKWGSYIGYKVIYIQDTSQAGGYNNSAFEPMNGSDGFEWWNVAEGSTYNCSSGCGWMTWYPSGTSDGSWHEFQVHVKAESSSSAHDGIIQVWMDGVQKMNVTTANFALRSKGALFYGFMIGSNADSPLNGGCYWVDYDNVAVSNSGYIASQGGTGGTMLATPNPPTNLH